MKILLGVLRLPLDFLVLTIDYIRVLLWSLVGLLVGHRRMVPPCEPNDLIVADGQRIRVCSWRGRYGMGFLIRWICRYPRFEKVQGKPVCLCERHAAWRPSGLRLVLSGVFLILTWAVLVGGAMWVSVRIAGNRPVVPRKLTSYVSPKARSEAEGYVERAVSFVTNGVWGAARIEYRNALQSDPANTNALLGLARCEIQLGLFKEASRNLDRLLQVAPDSIDARVETCALSRKLGNSKQALEHARKLRELKPNDPVFRQLLAECYREAGDLEQALKEATGLVELLPSKPEPLIMAATLELSLKDLSSAEQDFRKVLELVPDSTEAKVGLARVIQAKGDTNAALQELTMILQKEPQNTAALGALGYMYYQNRDWTKALSVYRDLAAISPKDYDSRARLAALLIMTGRLNEGYVTARELVKDNPRSVAGHLVLAETFLRQNLPSLAVDSAIAAAQADPTALKAHQLLVKAYMAEGSFQKAQEHLLKMARSGPNVLDVWLDLATCSEVLGKRDEAVEYLERAAKMAPDSAEPLVLRAQLWYRGGKVDEAIKTYRKALEKDARNVTALNNLSALLMDHAKGDSAMVEEAYRVAEKAWDASPDSPAVADTLGWARFLRKDYDGALALLAYSARQIPRNGVIRYHLGCALEAKGRLEEALTQLDLALKLAPKMPDAAKAEKMRDSIKTRIGQAKPKGETSPAAPVK